MLLAGSKSTCSPSRLALIAATSVLGVAPRQCFGLQDECPTASRNTSGTLPGWCVGSAKSPFVLTDSCYVCPPLTMARSTVA
jgi:hypothetical protein